MWYDPYNADPRNTQYHRRECYKRWISHQMFDQFCPSDLLFLVGIFGINMFKQGPMAYADTHLIEDKAERLTIKLLMTSVKPIATLFGFSRDAYLKWKYHWMEPLFQVVKYEELVYNRRLPLALFAAQFGVRPTNIIHAVGQLITVWYGVQGQACPPLPAKYVLDAASLCSNVRFSEGLAYVHDATLWYIKMPKVSIPITIWVQGIQNVVTPMRETRKVEHILPGGSEELRKEMKHLQDYKMTNGISLMQIYLEFEEAGHVKRRDNYIQAAEAFRRDEENNKKRERLNERMNTSNPAEAVAEIAELGEEVFGCNVRPTQGEIPAKEAEQAVHSQAVKGAIMRREQEIWGEGETHGLIVAPT
jgi:hypothetical protein